MRPEFFFRAQRVFPVFILRICAKGFLLGFILFKAGFSGGADGSPIRSADSYDFNIPRS